MNFRKFCCCNDIDKDNNLECMNLEQLEDEVFELTKKQNQISHCWGLSEETSSLVYKDLQEQKTEIIMIMHKKVDLLLIAEGDKQR